MECLTALSLLGDRLLGRNEDFGAFRDRDFSCKQSVSSKPEVIAQMPPAGPKSKEIMLSGSAGISTSPTSVGGRHQSSVPWDSSSPARTPAWLSIPFGLLRTIFIILTFARSKKT